MLIALWVLATIAVAEGVALIVLTRRLDAALHAITELHEQISNASQAVLNGSRGAVRTVWQTADLLRTQGLSATVRSSIRELADWALVERPDLARLAIDGRLAIMFSDIEGSTVLNEQIGDRAWARLIERHATQVGRLVGRHGGHVVKSQGDGFMIVFSRSREALHCAVDLQRSLAQRPDGLRVRIGIHEGTSVRRGDDLFGRNIAVAARVAALAEGGQVLVSEAVQESVGEVVGDGWSAGYDQAREVELRGLRGTYRLYAVSVQHAAAT